MTEVWKPVTGFESYTIDEFGNVFGGRFNKQIKPWLNKCSGYLQINLGRKNRFTIHYLVAITFLSNKNETINHKDGNKLNNHFSNLEWISYSENNKHAYSLKLRGFGGTHGSVHHNAKLTENDVIEIRKLYHSGEKPAKIAKIYRLNISTICSVIKRETWKHI